jgi:hypothetical protein
MASFCGGAGGLLAGESIMLELGGSLKRVEILVGPSTNLRHLWVELWGTQTTLEGPSVSRTDAQQVK